MIAAIIAFLKALPQLLRFAEKLEQNQESTKVQEMVESDKTGIDEAFKAKDPEKLRRVFDPE